MNAKFNVMRDLLVIRCVTSVRDEFAWHEVAQIRKLPEFFGKVVRVATACSKTFMTHEYYDLKVTFFYRFTVSVSAIQFQPFSFSVLSRPMSVYYKIDFQNQNTSYVVAFVRVAQET